LSFTYKGPAPLPLVSTGENMSPCESNSCVYQH
jgi:hypothetical protein